MQSIKLRSASHLLKLTILLILFISFFGFSKSSNAKPNKNYISKQELQKKMEQITYNAFITAIDLRKKYTNALNKSGFAKPLNANFLAEDESLVKSKKIFADARKVINHHKELSINSIYLQLKKDINNLNISPKDKKDALFYLKQGFSNEGVHKKVWQLEIKVLDSFYALINYLHRNRKEWEPNENGVFIFLSEKTLTAYDSYIAEIDSIAKQQASLQLDSLKNIEKISKDAAYEATKIIKNEFKDLNLETN